MTHIRSRTLVLALSLGFAFASGLGGAPSALTAGEANPLPRFLEAIQVGPAAEFRLAVIHPIYVPALAVPPAPADGAAPAAAPPGVPALAASAPQEALGLGHRAKDGRTSVTVQNLGTEPLWALPGDVLRLADADYAVREDAVLPAGESAELDVVRTSASPADEKPREEPRWVGSLPGPGMLWTLLSGVREKGMTAAATDFAKESGLATPRRSPVELAGAEKIAARVREYRMKLATLPRSPGAGKRELAGIAVVLDGGFAEVEIFADSKRFAALWPARLEGIAVEAALLEFENGVLETDLAEPTDPDRFTAHVKDSILAIYGLDPKPTRVPGLGVVLPLRKDPDLGRAVVHETAGPQHLLWVRDPARRRNETTEDTPFEPGPISRKARPTEAEKRWLDRRRAGE